MENRSSAYFWEKGLRPYLLLTVLCLALTLPGLSAIPPLDRDESRFSQATRQMVETGDYVTIWFQDTFRNKKPIGIHWLQALAVHATGTEETRTVWPHRLPSVLGATLAVLFTFGFGRRLFDARTAMLGASLLACSFLLTFEAHQATTDAALLAAVTAAQGLLALMYVRIREGRAVGAGTAILFWVAQGVGALLKGPIPLMVSALTAGALSMADRNARWLKSLRPVTGFLILAAMVLPWGIAIATATKGLFFQQALGQDLFGKVVTGQESHGFFPGYYLLLTPLFFWPGSLLLGFTAKEAWRRRGDTVHRALLAWIIPTWLVFEAIPTKLPHYVMPTYPALALLTACALLSFGRRIPPAAWPRWWSRGVILVLWSLYGLLMTVGLAALPLFLDGRFNPVVLAPAAIAGVVAVAGIRLTRQNRLLEALLTAMGGGVLVGAFLFQLIVPGLETLWLSRSVHREAEALKQHMTGGSLYVASSDYHEPSLVFLLGTKTELTEPLGAVRALAEHPSTLAVVDGEGIDAFRKGLEEKSISARLLNRLEGINYSKGRRTTLYLYTNVEAPEAMAAGQPEKN